MRVTDALALVGAVVLISVGLSMAAPATSPVEIHVFQFTPGQLEVRAGATVTWTNRDDIAHTVTSGTPEARDGRFHERLDGQGRAATVEFKERGVYPYFCERHPSMRGVIRAN